MLLYVLLALLPIPIGTDAGAKNTFWSSAFAGKSSAYPVFFASETLLYLEIIAPASEATANTIHLVSSGQPLFYKVLCR